MVVMSEKRANAPQVDISRIGVLHVMTTLHVFIHIALASRAESLDGEYLSFLHLCLVTALDNRHTLTGVNNIRQERMTIQVSNGFNYDDAGVSNSDSNKAIDYLGRSFHRARPHKIP